MNAQLTSIPDSVEEITPALLSALVSEMHPGASVEAVEVLEAREKGKMASTAGRVRLRLRYGAGSPALPERVIVKMVLGEPSVARFLYETEVQMYRRVLPRTKVERPLCLGAAYDASSGRFMVVLEDLAVRDAFFPTVLDPALTPGQMARLLDVLAELHAQYWEATDRLGEERWLGTLMEGSQADFFNRGAAANIDALVRGSPYRQDLITRVGRSPQALWDGVKAVHAHQAARLPQTLVHGDTGAHNSYHLPDGRCGFLDWQFSSRAAWPRDVHYTVCTGLSVADRRTHERALVQHYLQRLADFGVQSPPDIDTAMVEFGRAIIWGFTIGWLIVPERNYGMEIVSANLERLKAAMDDHDTLRLADEVMA